MSGTELPAAPDRSLDRAVTLSQLLFGVVILFVVVVQQVASDDTDRPGAFFLGVFLAFLGCGLAVAVPWHLFPRGWAATLPALDIIAIVCLRFADPSLGAGLLWIFPVIWLSSYFGIIGAIGSVLSVCAMIITGAFLTGDPVGTLTVPSVVILPLVLAAVAASTVTAARRSAARRQLLRSQSRVLESAMIRARRQENLLADVLDAVEFGVARVGTDGEVAVMNESHGRIMAAAGGDILAPDAAGGAPLFAANGLTPIDAHDAPLARLQRGEEFAGMIVWVGTPGRGIALSITARRLRSGPGAMNEGLVVVTRDVTTELAAVRARDDLVASVSHELRTPLTSIVGYLDLARDEELSEGAERYLQVADRNADRMLGLITDILAASTAGDGPVELTIDRRSTDLASVVAASVESLAPRARENLVTIDASGIRELHAVVDAFRIRQVVDNLVTNAIKYNREGGTVTVEAGPDESGAAVITVRDTGTGIAPEEVPRLFERFFRSESVRGSSVHGSGLGLGISRDIVRRHGGELTIESALGVGTVATVRIPWEKT
ncbi:sensor histidine kinase [Leifsonia flava]|uniref:Sensor-like histidine kinase SenX3 n=1 Tax=Orlajensenia leifsoniae TaxID=2561933 RepID=A0A4Y9QWS2_9MICO|nr:ATP-binding protein [Leifsonia flava]TFV96931.1 PAS domain-containing sensor histidine kinase [Leifsonia flava]